MQVTDVDNGRKMSPLARLSSTWGRIASHSARSTSQFSVCGPPQALIQTGFPGNVTAFTKGFTNGSINCLIKDLHEKLLQYNKTLASSSHSHRQINLKVTFPDPQSEIRRQIHPQDRRATRKGDAFRPGRPKATKYSLTSLVTASLTCGLFNVWVGIRHLSGKPRKFRACIGDHTLR